MLDLEKHKREVDKSKTTIKQLFSKLKRKPPNNLDDTIHQLHDEVFEEIDCLQCANCCKTTSPIFYERDIDRLARHLKVRPADFIDRYLRIDEDKDYVLKQSPCTFLDAENYCTVYEARPTACRDYPHTNRKRMYQIMDLTAKNAEVCPAVFSIFKKLEKIF